MIIIEPFIHFSFMRRALSACIALAISSTPLGIFLSLRRMSLFGDALSHAILPGVALGYLFFGLSLLAMGIGGLIVGLIVAFCSNLVSRLTPLKEDASFAGFYLSSLALGVTIVSLKGSSIDLLHFLFGSLLAVDKFSLFIVCSISTITIIVLAVIYRPLLIETFDSEFLRIHNKRNVTLVHSIFTSLLVLNLVAGFQVLGTLMSVGLMMLPATSARFWSTHINWMILIAIIIAIIASLIGLIISWYYAVPAGPTVVLISAFFFIISVLIGPYGGLLKNI